ncbi:MAG TPA: glycosyltransferase family 39 protein, partial [Pirellulales bacterium]|nr:glycosyltransferase family 39 protein [Pirellulales bacterium]
MKRPALDDEFANQVVDARSTTASRRPRGRLLIGLLICCAVPRVWIAVRLDTLCNDALFYIELAEGLERGDLEAGLGRLRLNTYPPVLALLHSVGLDWELAGKCWGVAMASLTVLPLFGWLRLQFNEQLAVVGCLLYAFHPKLIEWSPELIRDPTFWLLWTLGLYSSWRAASETRLSWYLLSGLVIALAIHTRFEGWFLYLPLMGWSVCRQVAVRMEDGLPGRLTRAGRPGRPSSNAARGSALRAAAGCAAAVAVCPLLLLAVNLTWLAGQPRWELGNFNRLEYVALWTQAVWQAVRGDGHDGARATAVDSSPSAAAVSTAPAALAAPVQTLPAPVMMPQRMGASRALWIFVNTLRRGFGVLFGLCWLAGFACRPRLWLRRDHMVLFLVAGCVAAGTWVHLWYAQATSSRYFLAIVVLAAPCAAMGCCWACRGLERAASWLFAWTSFVPQRIALARSVAVLVLLVIAAGA